MEFKFIYSMTMTCLKEDVLLAQRSMEALMLLNLLNLDATQDCDY